MDSKRLELINIRNFEQWELSLHEDQTYLGRSIIWCRNPGDRDFTEMTKEERDEFFDVASRLRQALKCSFSPDRANLAYFANTTNHLHVHVIPRYESPRVFAGRIFSDKNWGRNYAPYTGDKVPDNILIMVRDEIRSRLE